MSLEIIDILQSYSRFNQIMVVASLNQVDTFNSYVGNQKLLKTKFKDNLGLVCRDHCGPYFKYSDKSLILSKAVEECKRTIAVDIENGFDLIHIDVSRVREHPFAIAEELINFAIKQRSDILLEFGSEENNGNIYNQSIDQLLSFCQSFKENIKFIVAQTGSLVKNKQIGSFDILKNTTLINRVHEAGFLFKEHNGDYLNHNDLAKRQLAGVDAINVAPQLGVIQTQVLFSLAGHTDCWRKFAEKVFQGRMFIQWLDKFDNKLDAVLVSGHYFYNSDEYKNLLDNIDRDRFDLELKNSIYEVLDFYESRS